MLTRLRALWQDINASYWFYPALSVVASLALAAFTLWLDGRTPQDWLQDQLILRPANAESASTMLNAIAVSMMGVAATVFSITIAAVVYASGSYGPRLLNNFMEDRGNQLSLATFIGTFVYALTVLRAVRHGDEAGFVPQISLLTAYALMGLSVAVLVYFLNHIPSSIRINSVLKDIGLRLLRGVEKTYPERNSGTAPLPEHGEGVPVRAHGAGYIEVLDFDRLHAVAKKHGGKIVMAVRTGDFVHPSVTIARWCPYADGESDPPADAIRDCLALGSARTPHQDLQFLIDELVEIGLRALSPGINDPFTAITAIHWLSAGTARLGERDLRYRLDRETRIDTELVIPLDDDYGHFVARGFGAIRSSVATNRITAMVMFDALADAASTLDDEVRRGQLKQQGDLLIEQARIHLKGPELELVEARYVSFTAKFAGQDVTRPADRT